MTLTPFEALMQQTHARPKSTAFVFHNEAWTYERIAAESERLARGMAARGVKPGDRVALHMMNRPEFIIAYYGCFRLGAIAAPLRTAFKCAELAPLLQRLTPALYIGERGLYDDIAAVDGAILPRDRRFIVDGPLPGQDGLPWENLVGIAGDGNLFNSAAADQAAVLITTSGTTGEPKFVIHTPTTLAESVGLLIDNWGLSGEDVVAEPLALAHISGLISFLCYIQLGAQFVLIESFAADTVLDTIERYRCTLQISFPAQFAALLERQRARPRDLESLRYCLTGGDACPIELQQQVTSCFGAPLHNVWAATEAAGNLGPGSRPGPVMRIPKSTEIRLIDESGSDIADGDVGELLVRGANLFAGYWNDPQATAESLKGGWYHTGDLMRRGEGDELIFVARKKDIIIRGGTNISPVEVEQAIAAAHPAVAEAAVVGMPDAVLGQRVIGFVKLAQGAREAVVSEILDNLAMRLAAYKVPERLLVVDRLPRNALSKIDRKMLQVMAAAPDKTRSPELPVTLQPKRTDERPAQRAVPIR
jgi:long-chain acyl-CoA synthetase